MMLEKEIKCTSSENCMEQNVRMFDLKLILAQQAKKIFDLYNKLDTRSSEDAFKHCSAQILQEAIESISPSPLIVNQLNDCLEKITKPKMKICNKIEISNPAEKDNELMLTSKFGIEKENGNKFEKNLNNKENLIYNKDSSCPKIGKFVNRTEISNKNIR